MREKREPRSSRFCPVACALMAGQAWSTKHALQPSQGSKHSGWESCAGGEAYDTSGYLQRHLKEIYDQNSSASAPDDPWLNNTRGRQRQGGESTWTTIGPRKALFSPDLGRTP